MRRLSELLGALLKATNGGGSVTTAVLDTIEATEQERKILDDYGRALGPMPYVEKGPKL